MSELEKDYQEMIRKIRAEMWKNINLEFNDLLKETKERNQWHENGKCYKCGGNISISYNEKYPKSMYVVMTCEKCGKEIFNDAPFDYYFAPIIKKLLDIAGVKK